MKSGPTLNPWTVSPRRTRAASTASVTVVLPDPECVPAITTAGHRRPVTPRSSPASSLALRNRCEYDRS